MKAPVVILAVLDADVLMFEEASSAAEYLEPEDVLNGEYAAFDADGKKYSIELKKAGSRQRIVFESEVRQGDPDELRVALLAYLRRLLLLGQITKNELDECSSKDLSVVIKKVAQFAMK